MENKHNFTEQEIRQLKDKGGLDILKYLSETEIRVCYLKSLGVDIQFNFNAVTITNVPTHLREYDFDWSNYTIE